MLTYMAQLCLCLVWYLSYNTCPISYKFVITNAVCQWKHKLVFPYTFSSDAPGSKKWFSWACVWASQQYDTSECLYLIFLDGE